MRFIHFENSTSVNLEKVLDITLDGNIIIFSFKDIPTETKTRYYSILKNEWVFNKNEQAEKVYREILKQFSQEIKIED